MGKLGNQPVRPRRKINFSELKEPLYFIEKIIKNSNLTEESIIKILEILEYSRRTNVMIDDGDFKDEQIGGIGELIENFISSRND